jgi:hypothetical protein
MLESAIARLIGRISVRQVVPGGSSPKHPQNAIEDFTKRLRRAPLSTWASLWLFWLGQKRFDECPLGICEFHRLGRSAEDPSVDPYRKVIGFRAVTESAIFETCFSIDEQIIVSGESAACSVSTGRFHADTGWAYATSPVPPPTDGDYGVYVDISKGDCAGVLRIMLFADGYTQLPLEPIAVGMGLTYEALNQVGGCPATCRGGIEGTLVRSR